MKNYHVKPQSFFSFFFFLSELTALLWAATPFLWTTFNHCVPRFSPDPSSSQRKKRRVIWEKKATKPDCCFNHLRASDHKPVRCNTIHFYVLVKPLFHTSAPPVCKNTGNAFEVFLSTGAQCFNYTVHLEKKIILYFMNDGFLIPAMRSASTVLHMQISGEIKSNEPSYYTSA